MSLFDHLVSKREQRWRQFKAVDVTGRAAVEIDAIGPVNAKPPTLMKAGSEYIAGKRRRAIRATISSRKATVVRSVIEIGTVNEQGEFFFGLGT